MRANNDRITFILQMIDEWKKNDQELENKKGFLEYLETREIGRYKVGNTEIWLRYYSEARKKGITIVELLFDKARETMKTFIIKSNDRPVKKIPVDIVSEEKMKELKEISSRLKSHQRQKTMKQ
jgi:hypothetical protein